MKAKRNLILLFLFCVILTAGGVYLLGGVEPEQVEAWLEQAGIWAPIIYILLYIIGTLLLLPSTPLNLSGGAIFGVLWGTIWTGLAALLAAIIAFMFTRTVGRQWIVTRLKGRWESFDQEIHQGGLLYMSAIRLLPIIPYGVVNFAAGLTSIRFRDYLIGTAIGTIPGVLPFIMIGAGLQELRQGNISLILTAFTLVGLLVGVGTWYQRKRHS